jgi:hypothetical protein
MNDLSFTISSVSKSSKKRLNEMYVDVSTRVIEPISFTLDIGLEHTMSSGDKTPRTCIVGVLPGIVLRLAPSHVTKILLVAAIWTSNLGNLHSDVPAPGPTSLADVEEEAPRLSSGLNISVLDRYGTPAVSEPVSMVSNKTMVELILTSRQNSNV